MDSTVAKVVCGVVGLVLGLALVRVYFVATEPQATSIATVATTTEQSNSAQVIDAVYPLFSSNIDWGSKVAVSLPPRSNYNPTDTTIVGYQVTSLPSDATNNLAGIAEPLRHYYDMLLVKAGWSINTSFQADGPGGSLWGFTKGKDILILSYRTTFLNTQPDQPVQCPCTVSFTIIGGTLK